MEFTTLTHCFIISSLLTLSSQNINVITDRDVQENISLTNPINNEDTNSIVIEANTSSTKIVNEINNNMNTLIGNQNKVIGAGNGETISNLFSESSSCICVPYYLCRKNKTIITDGADIIDIRIKPMTCSSYLDICCNAPIDPTEVTTEIPNRYPNENTDGILTGNSGCGRRNFEGAGVRIKGDVNNEAQFGEFPWMIAVLRTEKVDENITMNLYQCGGSLIHPRVVMTAAHCVANRDLSTLLVRAGEWDTQTRNERLTHVDQKITQIIVHEKYYSGGLFNDIALLITEKPFNLTSHIDTVCLPPQNSVIDDVTCTASGWGKDVFGKEGKYQVILKKVDLPMVARNKCERKLQTTNLSKFFKLHESFVCAGGEAGRDTCKGDGGGPLVCPTSIKLPSGIYETRYQQAGIIAWGVNCGEDGIPGVYANVALFKNWIDNWMRQLKFDIRYYTL